MYKAEGDITTFWSSEKVWEEMFKVRNILETFVIGFVPPM
jgi:hypothetical protein